MSESNDTVASSRKLVALAGTIGVMTLACFGIYGAYLASQQAFKPSALTEPAREVLPSPEHLSVVLAVALLPGPSPLERSVAVPYEDVKNFMRHLRNAAALRGWFVYEPNGFNRYLVMPAEEMPVLDLLEADPVNWVVAESSRLQEPRGPSTLNLVKVSLEIERDGNTLALFWAAMTGVLIISSGLSLIGLVLYWMARAYDAWRRRHPSRDVWL